MIVMRAMGRSTRGRCEDSGAVEEELPLPAADAEAEGVDDWLTICLFASPQSVTP
jgi:hypothetical protein